jgi:cobalt-zinc-cadmium efflux system outer membrane protein
MQKIGVIAYVVLLVVPLDLAASEKERLSLQQAIELAIQMNQEVKVADDRVASSLGQKSQAGLKPNPRLVVQQENARFGEFASSQPGGNGFVFFRDTDTYVYGAQLIERGGKRERRVEYANAGVNRTLSERDMTVRQLKGRVAMAYWSAVSAEKTRALYDDELHTVDRIVQDTQNLVREGASAGADLLRMQIERERIAASAENVRLEADRTRIALLREIGRSDFPDLELTDAIDSPIDVTEQPIDQVFAQRTEVQTAKAAVTQAQAYLKLQVANAKTDPEVQLGYKRTLGFDTLYAGLNIQLPIRNRNQGNIASAGADVHTAESVLSLVQQQIRAEVETAQHNFESKQQIVARTLKPLTAKSDEELRITLGAYQQGGFDLLRYLDALRVQIEDQIMFYQGLGQEHISAIALQQAQGDLR